jgi:hypothetical protein
VKSTRAGSFWAGQPRSRRDLCALFAAGPRESRYLRLIWFDHLRQAAPGDR